MNAPFSAFFTPIKPGEMVKMSTTLTAFPFDVGTLMETCRQNMKAMATVSQLSLESLQVIAHRNSALFSTLTAGQTNLSHEWTQSETPENKIGDQALMIKDIYEQTVNHLREINDMISQSGQEGANIIHHRVGASLVEMKEAIDRARTKRAA